jgi:hypothetical protein
MTHCPLQLMLGLLTRPAPIHIQSRVKREMPRGTAFQDLHAFHCPITMRVLTRLARDASIALRL